jgi:hypothetical protein
MMPMRTLIALLLWFEEEVIRVRSVNRDVARRAGLILLRLVMECWDCRSCGIHRQRMTLETQQIDIAATQQPRIRRSMRRMASDAPFDFHRRVLERERTGLVGMAIEAELILRGGRAELLRQETAMLIVAVAARQQSLVHTMMKRPRKVGLHVQMTLVTELRLRGLQKIPLDRWSMHRMAGDASDVVLLMLGPQEITVLLVEFMAVEASAARIWRR